MMVLQDIWKMMAGVAIFLLGMNFMEESLRSLAGRKFKLFLKKQTANKVKAIGGGAAISGFLQSSSVVNLLVLSLVGAGVIKMQNALAVILGSNLGTTLGSWMVATLGFKLDIDSIALSLAGITGILMAFLAAERRLHQWNKLLFGLSLLFIGLGFIKSGMMEVLHLTDLSSFNQYPVIIFFLIGLGLTALIQSSSATVALTLSALYTGAISLHVATAIVLGSEIGTTIKLFIASVRGTPEKKRVALGNFLFNVTTVLVILIVLRPVNHLITDVLKIHDSLIGLVFFQSFVNFTGIIIFFPFLNLFGQFLEKRFALEDESFFINKVSVEDSELALEALEKVNRKLIFYTLDFVSNVFDNGNVSDSGGPQKNFVHKSLLDQYDLVKRLHGEIHGFSIRLQNTSLTQYENKRLNQLISTARNCMYGAKSVRDALQDIIQFRNSSKDVKYGFYLLNRDKINKFIIRTNELFQQHLNSAGSFGIIKELYENIQQDYTISLKDLYKEGMAQKVNELEISTFINFNREMFTAFKSILFALKDYMLNPAEADYFDELPGFIR